MLPKGWAEATIGDIATLVGGSGFPKEVQGKLTGQYPFAKVSDISRCVRDEGGRLFSAVNYIDESQLKSLHARLVPSGSIVFAKIGEALKLNRRAIAQVSLVVDNNVLALVPRNNAIDSEYLFRCMMTIDLGPLSIATAVPSVRVSDVSAIPIPLPPILAQQRIVAKLDALTARLARARAELDQVKLLSGQSQLSVLRAGVTGLLTADWRKRAVVEPVDDLLRRVVAPQQGRGGREATDKVILGSAGLAVNDPGVPLPLGWQWVPLLRLAKQETGHTPSRSRADYWDGAVPWIGIRDAGAHHGGPITETIQTISKAGLDNSSARLLPKGTVCLSRTASVGYVTIMARPMSTSQDFATWTCTEALVPEYLMYALMAEGDGIRKFGMGTTHTTIYFPEIRALHIALPPIAEQREIVARIKSQLAHVRRLKAEAKRARALIDRLESAILAKAFRGELVPQDPNDEPASVLLDRIRAERAAAPKPTRGRRATATAA